MFDQHLVSLLTEYTFCHVFFQAGVPRMAYMGIVSFVYSGQRVYLAPPPTWKGYDPKWS